MIIQTGQRTDIPAFYTPWFLNRLREGYVLVRNPYNPSLVTRYSLSPDVVDIIGFCTKNPAPMLKHMDALKPYGQYWFVTITPYGKDIEPNVPNIKSAVDAFISLSQAVGINSVGWRYDPILINEDWTVERHIKAFEWIAQRLEGFTETAVISFIDLYPKVKRNFPEIKEVPQELRLKIGKELAAICKKHGMTLRPCAEGSELSAYGADCSGCMTIPIYEKALGKRLNPPKSLLKQNRKECACYLSCDIGAYNSCGHLCRYCYANSDENTVRQNMALHDPKSPFLIGSSMPGDVIHEAKQESWIDDQLSLFSANDNIK